MGSLNASLKIFFTNNGPEFRSNLIEQFRRERYGRHVFIFMCYLQANGLVERFKRVLDTNVQACLLEHPSKITPGKSANGQIIWRMTKGTSDSAFGQAKTTDLLLDALTVQVPSLAARKG